MAIVLLVYFLTAFLTSSVYVWRSSIAASRLYSQSVSGMLLQSARYLEQITGQAVSILDAAKANRELRQILARDVEFHDIGQELDDFFALNRIRQAIVPLHGEHTLRLYIDSAAIYTRERFRYFPAVDLESVVPSLRGNALDGQTIWFVADIHDRRVLLTIARILDLASSVPFRGYLTVEYPMSRLQAAVQSIESAVGGRATIVDAAGNVIVGRQDPDGSPAPSPTPHSVVLREPRWRLEHRLDGPPHNLTQPDVVWPLLGIWTITAVAFGLLARLLSSNLTRRIEAICDAMRTVARGGTPDDTVDPTGDEISELSLTFRDLLRTKQNLSDLLATERLRIQKVELDVLEASINPHFLYNTLDAITWEAKAASASNVAGMLSLVASFYRRSCEDGRHQIPLNDEIDRVRLYVAIERMRTDIELECTIEVSEEAGRSVLPRMVLQPLIENALEHGVRENEGSTGTIGISCWVQGPALVVCVEDNGPGMKPETLMELSSGSLRRRNSGYGIANVCERLRLLYGEAASLTYSTVSPHGTRARLQLPATCGVQ